MGTYLFRTENVTIGQAGAAASQTTFTHGLGVAPAMEAGEVFIRHRTFTYAATVLSSSTQIVVISIPSTTPINVDVLVMAFHTIIK